MALTTDRDRCAHLLRRFGLGASEAELDFYLKDGFHGAIERLLNDDDVEETLVAPDRMNPRAKKNFTVQAASDWWIAQMLMTRKPLREKMTLFWHNHFATSGSKVLQGQLMVDQNRTFREHALGDFPTLLEAVSKDPAMIFWLDNQENQRGKPNENFAREVMELFTLGIGNYSEHDVKESARAFTGWSLVRVRSADQAPRAEYFFRPFVHDDGEKTVLGKSGNLNGDDVLKILTDKPRCAEFITHKIWSWFVWPNPDEATIAPFAKRFHESGLNIKALISDIVHSKEFYSPKAERTVVKTPVDFCVTTYRQMGVGQEIADRIHGVESDTIPAVIYAPARYAQTAMKGMGMWLLFPPDVSGWKGGSEWITSATMVERMKWADGVFPENVTPAARATGQKGARGPQGQRAVTPEALFGRNPSADELVGHMLALYDAPIKPEKRKTLVALAQKSLDGGTLREAAHQVSRLIFASPEFQFC